MTTALQRTSLGELGGYSPLASTSLGELGLQGISAFIENGIGWVAAAASTAWTACFSGTKWKTDLDSGASWDADNCCK